MGWPNADRFVVATRALMRACEHGWEPIVRILLEHGAELKDDALAIAAKRGHMNVVKVLVELGADVNQGKPRAIVSAISLERKDMFYGLLELGATLDGESGREALEKAREEGLTSMLALVGEHGVDIRE
jgi:ankyrin repeat protein